MTSEKQNPTARRGRISEPREVGKRSHKKEGEIRKI